MQRTLLTSLLLGLCALFAGPIARSATDADVPLSAPWAARSYAITLKELAPTSKLELLGVDGKNGVYFGLRGDERVARLRTELTYSYSSALVESLSHLNVVLNGEVVDSIALTPQDQGRSLQHQTELPIALLRPHNRLEVQLIAHYTLGCEDPLHPDLWAHIDMGSRILLDVDPVVLPDDLKLLPAPFFYTHDVRPLELPFVLPNANDDKLQAAGVLASWLGALAGYRGTRFTADSVGLPARGHAVVVMAPSDVLPGVTLPRISGPTVHMLPNPNDSTGKLLVVTGRNAAEIRTAAAGLVLGGPTLSGPVALFDHVQVDPRKPYDAPNWIPVDRPVELGELASARSLTAAGRDPWPIEMRLRVPPDLSRWRVKNVPLNLRYRYVRHGLPAQSTLEVLINQQRIKRLDLNDESEGALGRTVFKDTGIVHERVSVPLHSFGSDANLQFKFRYEQARENECTGTLVDIRRSAIDPESTIDFSGIAHHMAMPDLAAFRSAGFPFTRMADLSESVVVLPPQTSPSTMAAFLRLMGAIGEATAYPAVAMTVTSRADTESLRNKDILVLSTGNAHPLLKDWGRYLPVASVSAGASTAPFWSLSGFLDHVSMLLGTSPSQASVPVAAGGTVMAGFESPITARRSVVVFNAASDAALLQAVGLMSDHQAAGLDVQGSSVQISDGRVTRLSDEKTYYVGELGAFRTMQWFLAQRPMMLVGLYMLGALLIGVLFYLSLRARAQRRLRSDEQ